jgi:hypothetical protein
MDKAMKLTIDTQERTITIDGPCDFDELKIIVEALGGKWSVQPSISMTVTAPHAYPAGPIWVDPNIVQPGYPWSTIITIPPYTPPSYPSDPFPTITFSAEA